MSVQWTAKGVDPIATVDASTADQTVPLTKVTPGRIVTVRRVDSSTAHTVTVQVGAGLTLDGVANASTTVDIDSQTLFVAVDGGFESLRGGGGVRGSSGTTLRTAAEVAADTAFTGGYATPASVTSAVAAQHTADLGTFAPATGSSAYAPAGLPSGAVAALATGRFDPSRSLYGLTPSNIRRFRQQLAAAVAGSGECRIMCCGDSTTQGYGDSAVRETTAYPAALTSRFTAAGHSVGTGAVPASTTAPADGRWTFTGVWTGAAIYNQTSASGATATFTSDRAGTSVEFWYLDATNATSFTYAVDGGSTTTVNQTGSLSLKSVVVTGLSSATHVLTITNLNATILRVVSAEVRGASTIGVSNYGVGGNGSSALNSTNYANVSQLALGARPDIVLTNIGINDYYSQVAIATYKENVAAWVGRVGAAGSDHILAVPTPRGSPPAVETIHWSSYVQAVYEVAVANSLPVLDFTDRWIDYTHAAAIISTDTVHPKPAGYADIARAWFAALTT